MKNFLLVVLIVLAIPACTHSGMDVDHSISKIRHYCITREIDSALVYSYKLLEDSKERDDKRAYLLATVYLGQCWMLIGNTDSMTHYVNLARPMAEEMSDARALATINNFLGSWYLYNNHDYEQSVDCLLAGLKQASIASDDTILNTIKCNLALVYYLRQDPSGIEYAQDVFRLGTKQGNEFMIFSGAMTAAYSNYAIGQNDSALYYIEKALPLASKFGDIHGSYTLYGDILLQTGDKEKAVRCFKTAMSADDFADRLSGTDVYLSYGKFLYQEGRYTQALEMIEEGISISETKSNTTSLMSLYLAASEICKAIEDTVGYSKYSGEFKAIRDSIFNLETERNISALKIRFEKDKHSRAIHDINERKQKQVMIWTLSSAVLLASLIIVVVISMRQNKKRKKLMDMITEYRKNIQSSDNPAAETNDNGGTSVTDIRMKEIFDRLEQMMKEQKLYKDPSVSRDKVADLLNTNRTYLTNTISKFTGMSFLAYINAYRIAEAERLLSDPDNTTPIKAIAAELGYGSLSTFYKFFSATTGYSPSQYRNKDFRK